MAELSKLIEISVEDLEGNLGSNRLQQFVAESEANFAEQVKTVADCVIDNKQVKVFLFPGRHRPAKRPFPLILPSFLVPPAAKPICCQWTIIIKRKRSAMMRMADRILKALRLWIWT